MGVCNCSMFCCTLLCVRSSIAIILMGKRELVALLNLSSWCLVMVERLFLAVPQGCLRFVIVVFPDHTHLLFFIQIFQNAGENLKKAVLYIFNISWLEGQLPSTWKSANVQFLRKQGKSDYYSPSSYRPISLTSVLGKLMERIILARLEAYIEGNRYWMRNNKAFAGSGVRLIQFLNWCKLFLRVSIKSRVHWHVSLIWRRHTTLSGEKDKW